MTDIQQLISETNHRPYDLPEGRWRYYQEWNNALFLHWKVPLLTLQKLVPATLNIDTFGGDAYVSLVAFTMQEIRPRGLPAVAFISDFHEINIRTYIDNDGKKGVYFLNIEAEKPLSVFIAKFLSGLPYEKAEMTRTTDTFQSKNAKKDFYLDVNFTVEDRITPNDLDTWLTERYCLYNNQGSDVYRFDIHHKEWKLNHVDINQLRLQYAFDDILLTPSPDLAQYSHGVNVVAWGKTRL